MIRLAIATIPRTNRTRNARLSDRQITRAAKLLVDRVIDETLVTMTPVPTTRDIIDSSKVSGRSGKKMIETAYLDCEKAHVGQFRKDNVTPYSVHPKYVALKVAEAGGTANQVVAALLHDVIEDCAKRGYCYTYIRQKYGREVAQLVSFMTKPKWDGKQWVFADGTNYDKVEDKYDDNMYATRNKAYYARLFTYHGIRAFVIKLPDIFHSLITAENLAEQRRDRNLRMIGTMLNVIARFDYGIYQSFVTEMRKWRYEFRTPEKVKTRNGVVELPPRTELDLNMIRRLPIRLPDSIVISVYVDRTKFRDSRKLEIGVPRIWNGSTRGLLEETLPSGLRISAGRSLLSSELDASERIYVVELRNRRTDVEVVLDRIIESLGDVNRRLLERI